MPSILVSGPVKGQHADLFKAVAKAQKKGSFAAVLCVGDFLGDTKEAPADSAPVPVYVVTGSDAIDADLASRLAAKNMVSIRRNKPWFQNTLLPALRATWELVLRDRASDAEAAHPAAAS